MVGESLGCIMLRNQSVEVVCPETGTAVSVAVRLGHQMGGKRWALSCHTVCQYVVVSTRLLPNHFKIY